MSSFVQVTLRVIAAVSLVALGSVVAPAAQAAPVGCHDSSCTDRNSQTQGCAHDAVTVAERTWADHAAGSSGTLTVELRFSKKCDASWSRVHASGVGTVRVTQASAWVEGHESATVRSRVGSGNVNSLMRSGANHTAKARVSFNNGAVVQNLAVHA